MKRMPKVIPTLVELNRDRIRIGNFDDLDAMLESIVEGVASYARVSRVGLFSIADGSDTYQLKAGTKCVSSN